MLTFLAEALVLLSAALQAEQVLIGHRNTVLRVSNEQSRSLGKQSTRSEERSSNVSTNAQQANGLVNDAAMPMLSYLAEASKREADVPSWHLWQRLVWWYRRHEAREATVYALIRARFVHAPKNGAGGSALRTDFDMSAYLRRCCAQEVRVVCV
jgi:hypothetical protein